MTSVMKLKCPFDPTFQINRVTLEHILGMMDIPFLLIEVEILMTLTTVAEIEDQEQKMAEDPAVEVVLVLMGLEEVDLVIMVSQIQTIEKLQKETISI